MESYSACSCSICSCATPCKLSRMSYIYVPAHKVLQHLGMCVAARRALLVQPHAKSLLLLSSPLLSRCQAGTEPTSCGPQTVCAWREIAGWKVRPCTSSISLCAFTRWACT